MKNTIYLLLLSLILISCETTSTKKEVSETKKEEIEANYKSIEVEIEGMTCEIGCAKTIASKLSKMDGISYANVSFEDKKGTFTYNANLISKEDIKVKIEGIAGGDLYFVKKMTDLTKILQNSN